MDGPCGNATANHETARILEMLSCSKCLLPETAEATSFDDHGSCSVCAQIEVRDTQINWDERHAQMMELVAQYRDKGLYDCIVPYSGGKDSVFQLWYVVQEARPEAAGGALRPLVLPAADRREQHQRVQAARRRRAELHAELACRARADAGIAQAPRRFLLALPHRHLCPHHADRDPLRDAAVCSGARASPNTSRSIPTTRWKRSTRSASTAP